MRFPLLVLASVGVLASLARADGFDGQRFAPAAGAAGGFEVERPLVPQHLGFGAGLFLHYGFDSVVDRDRPNSLTRHPLHHMLTMDLLASLGLGDFFELAVDLPVEMLYRGDTTFFQGANLAAGAGVGNLRLVPKFAWQFGRTDLNYGVGFIVPVSFPTGDENALRGAGGFTLDPRLLFAIGGYRWNLAFNGGFRWRPGSKTPDFTGGRELTWGAAGTFNLIRPLDLLIELFGGWQPSSLFRGGISVPLEAMAGLVIKPAHDWSIYVGGGSALTNGLATPDFRLLAGLRYAHRVPDENRFKDDDHDGIDNLHDRCPDQAEDFDGFQDEDGCPDEDNDKDGVPDDVDECPDQAAEPGDDKDHDGCPDHARVILRRGQIVIFGKVHFETGSATIHKKSQPLLDQVAEVLKGHPEVGNVQVEGYTDNVGSPNLNLRLSRQRADSVRRALVERGVPKQRLRAEGFGETHPVAPNRTAAGRAKNRRVEFAVAK